MHAACDGPQLILVIPAALLCFEVARGNRTPVAMARHVNIQARARGGSDYFGQNNVPLVPERNWLDQSGTPESRKMSRRMTASCRERVRQPRSRQDRIAIAPARRLRVDEREQAAVAASPTEVRQET